MELQTHDNPFRFLLRVRYCECDAQLVVFNARYGDYVDTASTEYFRALFGDYQVLLDQGLDCQVVKLSTEWKSPARFDDVVQISVETSHIGNTSFSYQLTFRHYGSEQLIAVSNITYVMVDAKEFTKASIPDAVKNKLAEGAPGQMVNQAGIELTKVN
ncbi:MAG: acyl-CoA thioesterase [Pseudomonadales bacterium]|nr:acyl-CoA thioesterase [Pseudomonadales bacterium]